MQGNGIFDGPNDQASITAMKTWGVNAVRVPLNEACWNAESYVNSAYAGANYQNAIKAYVNLLNANGMVAILDLHWTDGAYTGPSAGLFVGAGSLPEADAGRGPGDPVLDLGRPDVQGQRRGHLRPVQRAVRVPGHRQLGRAAGQCWLNGGTCSGISYQVAGMQSMVNAVRSAGASNVIMLGGEEYANDLGTPGSTSVTPRSSPTCPPTPTTTWPCPGTPTTSTPAPASRAGPAR